MLLVLRQVRSVMVVQKMGQSDVGAARFARSARFVAPGAVKSSVPVAYGSLRCGLRPCRSVHAPTSL